MKNHKGDAKGKQKWSYSLNHKTLNLILQTLLFFKEKFEEFYIPQFSSVQSLSHVQLSATP